MGMNMGYAPTAYNQNNFSAAAAPSGSAMSYGGGFPSPAPAYPGAGPASPKQQRNIMEDI